MLCFLWCGAVGYSICIDLKSVCTIANTQEQKKEERDVAGIELFFVAVVVTWRYNTAKGGVFSILSILPNHLHVAPSVEPSRHAFTSLQQVD